MKNETAKTDGARTSPESANTPSQNPFTPNAIPKNNPQIQQASVKTAK